MKPSTSNESNNSSNTRQTTQKSSTKKQTVSKSKQKKSTSGSHSTSSAAQQQQQQQQQPSTSAQASGNNSGESTESFPSVFDKYKKDQKAYVGLNAKSVKCYWEQRDKTEVSEDVYECLAEDVTYRLWELVNTIKTYSRHSGGNVTVDLVNEVLKDMDVPPCYGADNTNWQEVDYDGTYFYNFDEVLELRDEYLKEVSLVQPGPMNLSATWLANNNALADIMKLANDIHSAIFTGNDKAFDYAMHICYINPYIGSIAKLLLVRAMEAIVPAYTESSLQRCLRIMEAIVDNYYTNEVDLDDLAMHLSQLFVCLLFKPLNLNAVTTNMYLKAASTNSGPKVEFKQVVEESAADDRIRIKDEPMDSYEHEPPTKIRIKEETEENNTKQPNNAYKEEYENMTEVEFYSTVRTNECKRRYVEQICRLIGNMANKWGNFENEIIFVLSKRLDIYFKKRNKELPIDFNWLTRMVRCLTALGNYAIRQLIPYWCEIDPDTIPYNCIYYFNQIAMFFRGRSDIFFYEYLSEVCGDGLMPYMIYYSKYLMKLEEKWNKFNKLKSNDIYKIGSMVKLVSMDRPAAASKQINNFAYKTMSDWFKDYTPVKRSKIEFNVAGCSSTNAKLKSIQNPPILHHQTIQINSKGIENFNKKIRIGRRVLLRPLTNRPQIVRFHNFHHLIL